MSGDTLLILIAGCAVFAVTTLAALWTGYLLLQERWVAENPHLTFEDDGIRPLFEQTYPEQRGRHKASSPIADETQAGP